MGELSPNNEGNLGSMVGNRLLPPGYRATVDRLSNFLEVPGLGFSSRRSKRRSKR